MNTPDESQRAYWSTAALGLALLVAILAFPGLTYTIDDINYLNAAHSWQQSFPFLGDTHWSLRHTIVLPLAGAMALFGPGIGFTLVLPTLYTLVFFGLAWRFLSLRLSPAVASGWALMFLAAPVVRVWAGLNYPDFLELLYVSVSIMALAAGAQASGGRRTMLFLCSGATAALALITRETAIWIVLLYAAILIAGKPVPRRAMLLVAAGAAPIMLADMGYLWAMSGDPWYRFSISTGHIRIPSDDLVGRVYEGRTLLNPELASRWIPDGPVNLHWAINPLIYAFADLRYGLIWWLLLFLALADRRGGRDWTCVERCWIRSLSGIALLSFTVSTYVLMISQRPRYYLVALCCAAMICAILLNRNWHRPLVRRASVAILIVHAAIALFTVNQGRTRVPYRLAMQMAAGIMQDNQPVHVEEDTADRLRWAMTEPDFAARVRTGTPPPGGRFLVVEDLRKGRALFVDPWAAHRACWRSLRTVVIRKESMTAALNALGLPFAAHGKPQIKLHFRQRSTDPACTGIGWP